MDWLERVGFLHFLVFFFLFLVLLLAVFISSAFYLLLSSLPSCPGITILILFIKTNKVRTFSPFLFMFIILLYSISPSYSYLVMAIPFSAILAFHFPYPASMTAMCPRAPFPSSPIISEKKRKPTCIYIQKLGQLTHSLRVIYTLSTINDDNNKSRIWRLSRHHHEWVSAAKLREGGNGIHYKVNIPQTLPTYLPYLPEAQIGRGRERIKLSKSNSTTAT